MQCLFILFFSLSLPPSLFLIIIANMEKEDREEETNEHKRYNCEGDLNNKPLDNLRRSSELIQYISIIDSFWGAILQVGISCLYHCLFFPGQFYFPYGGET